MQDIRLKVMEAIAHQQIIATKYNGKKLHLAPHLLFERRGDLFICAFNLCKSWRDEGEWRLGQFKLAGLGPAQLLDEKFSPLPSFQAAAPRADDRLLMAV